MSGACMNGLYEELEEWGCEWIRQGEILQPSPSTGGTRVSLYDWIGDCGS